MTGAYASDNQGYLKSRGIDASPGNSYLAHFAGPQGAAALHANPQASAAATLGSRVIAANPFLQGKTGADVIDWASTKVGNEQGARGMAGSNLSERLPMPAIGGAPIAGGPVPLTAPNMRYSKLADALLASAAGAKPKGWGDLLNSAGDLALGYTLSDKADKQQGAYKSSLAQALMGANDTDSMARTLMSTGDDDLVKQGVALKVAQNKPQSNADRFMTVPGVGVMDMNTKQIVPGTEPKDVSKATDMEKRAAAGGLKPGTPEYNDYVLKGPRDQQMTDAQRKQINEADDAILANKTVIDNLDQAIAKNDQAYTGLGASTRGYLSSLVGAEGGEATQDVENLVQNQALQQLKSIFGGMPTEGERKILLELQGSVGQSPQVRKEIWKRAKSMAQSRLSLEEQRSNQLRGGTYFRPGGGMSVAPKGDKTVASPSAEKSSPITGPRKAPDGNWYVPDPARPGKYLRVDQ